MPDNPFLDNLRKTLLKQRKGNYYYQGLPAAAMEMDIKRLTGQELDFTYSSWVQNDAALIAGGVQSMLNTKPPRTLPYVKPGGFDPFASLRTYKFKEGDDPVTIAAQNGITPQQLLDANPGGTPFSTGQNIRVPKNYGTDDSWYAPPAAPTTAATPAGPRPTPAGNTDYSQTQAAQQYAAAGTPFLQQMRWDKQRKKYIPVGKWLKETHRQRRNARQAQRPKQQKQQDFTSSNSFIDFSLSAG